MEKTNIFQLSGLFISVLGILAIITRLDLNILLSLNFNKGDLFMIGAIIAWGVYSAYLRKRNFDVSLLALVQIICTFGLIFLLPLFFNKNSKLILFLSKFDNIFCSFSEGLCSISKTSSA